VIIYIKCQNDGKSALLGDMIDFIDQMDVQEKQIISNEAEFEMEFIFVHTLTIRAFNENHEGEDIETLEEENDYKIFHEENYLKIYNEVKKSLKEKKEKNGKEKRVITINDKNEYIKFSSLLATFTFRIINIAEISKEEKIKYSEALLDKLFYLSTTADGGHIYFPVTAMHSYFTKEIIDQEKVFSLKEPRSEYKRTKTFGKAAMMRWAIKLHDFKESNTNNFELIMNKTLLSVEYILSHSQDPDAVRKSVEILNEIYNLLKPYQKNQFLDLYSKCMDYFSSNFTNLNPVQKEFFYRQMMNIHKILFVDKCDAQITK